MMEGNEESIVRTPRTPTITTNANRDVTLPQLLLALHSPLETWKTLDKVKYKSMELISMVNMDVARNGDNVMLTNTNGHLQKCVGMLSSLEEALTMVLLSPDSNLKFGVESLRNLGNGVEETDELSIFGAHGGNNPNGDNAVPVIGCQLGSTRSGLPYLERLLQNYIRRIDDIVCQIESQLKSSSRVQESRYASVVLQAHGLRPSVAEYLVSNLYLRGTGISSMQNWVAERINKLNLESQTFEQLMERDSGNSSAYMSAVQHENHRVQEELKALRTAERILQYLGRLERKEKKRIQPQDTGVGNALSNDWETFARFLTRIYTLINTNTEVLSDLSPLRRELLMEERKTWADFQRNSSREMRVLDASLSGNLLTQDEQQQSNFYDERRGSRDEPLADSRSRFQTPSWARDPAIPSTRFADKQFIHYPRLSGGDTDRAPVSAFRRILRGDEHHHSHPLHNPYCSNVSRNSFNELNQLPHHQSHSEMPFDAPLTPGNIGGFAQNVGVECQRDPYDLSQFYNRLYSSRLGSSNHLRPQSRYNTADNLVTQPQEHQTSSINDTLMSSLLLDIRNMRQTMSEQESYFRTIIDTLRIQQETISDLRRLVGSGNRNLADLDNKVDQLKSMFQQFQPLSSSSYQSRRDQPTHQHHYDERIGRSTNSQSLYDTLLYSSNLDLSIAQNNEDNIDNFLGFRSFTRSPRDINLSPRPPCYSEVEHLGSNDDRDNSTMGLLQQLPSQEDSPSEEMSYLMREDQNHLQASPNHDDPAEVLNQSETRQHSGTHTQGRRRKHRPDSLHHRQSPGSGGAQAQQNNSVSVTLNNQVAPGTRANNYWDNFRSYSHQNMLSTSKLNRSGGGGSGASPSGSEGYNTLGSSGSRLGMGNNSSASEGSPSTLASGINGLSGNNSSRRNSRTEKVGPGGKTALSANFVENIGLKKRNELGKQGSGGISSPSRSNSSNSIPCQEASGVLNLFNEEDPTPTCSFFTPTAESNTPTLPVSGTTLTAAITSEFVGQEVVRENDLNQPSSSHNIVPDNIGNTSATHEETVRQDTTLADSDFLNLQRNHQRVDTTVSNIAAEEESPTTASDPFQDSVLNLNPSGD